VNGARLALVLLAATSFLPAQDLKEFEKRVTEFTLANGLHFTVVERHDAPVASFHTFVNAGSADDPAGETGLAHMFEHMAFKGTESIGTRNWAAEKKALQTVEDVYDRIDAERNKGPKADQSKIDYLGMQLKEAIDVAQSYVESDEYTRIIEENGGVDLNADTSFDYTEYFCSLPSNRIELWFLLESQRFLHPVFREFYKERDVVQEENRLRNQPGSSGELWRDFVASAFEAFPYRNPPGGWPSDVDSLRRGMAQEFFEKYYVPANINIAIVGDVDPAQTRRLAERYFGPMPARPLPPLIHTVEPVQDGPKTAIVESRNQPLFAAGFKRPDQYDKDDPVYEVIALILASGRTGLLYTGLVQQKKIVKASGRDTGDAMKLSRDKITDISHKLIVMLKKSRDLRFKKDQNDARLDIVKAFTEILQVEEKADRAARDKVRSIKRDIAEGSEEWDILQKRYYSEELKKYGIDTSK